jgi:hypothetical protein
VDEGWLIQGSQGDRRHRGSASNAIGGRTRILIDTVRGRQEADLQPDGEGVGADRGQGSPGTDGWQMTLTLCVGYPGVLAVIPVVNVAVSLPSATTT